MTLALSTAFLASGLTVLFTVPVSAGQVDGGLGRWLMFIGAVGGLALIAAGLVLLVRARDAEMRHRDRIRQVVAFQHELRWHMSEMASGSGAAAGSNDDTTARCRSGPRPDARTSTTARPGSPFSSTSRNAFGPIAASASASGGTPASSSASAASASSRSGRSPPGAADPRHPARRAP